MLKRAERPDTPSTSWWTDCLFLTIVIGVLFFFLLGNRPLFVPDEGRYAEIAREMAARNDFITPYLNSIKYFEKPALFYWLGAIAIKLAGPNLWAVRSINALLGLIGCLGTYITGRILYNRQTGLLAALILSTSTLYFVMSHMVSLDLPVTVFLSLSLYAFLLGSQQPAVNRRRYCWSAAIFAAFAVLTKGLIGIVFPGLIIGAWLSLTRQWRGWRSYYFFSSLLIFFIVTAPWHIIVSLRNPEFFYFYFIEQHFLRYTTMDVGHYQPVWFFIPVLAAAFFPWIVFLPQTIINAWRSIQHHEDKAKTNLFFILWAGIIFTFFSFSKSKLIPYLLPVIPPLALLTAHYLQQARTGLKAGYFILFLLSIGITYGITIFIRDTALPDPALTKYLLFSGTGILITGSLYALLIVYRNTLLALSSSIVTAWLFLITIFAAFPSIDTRTIQPLANIIAPLLTPEDEVISFNQYYQDLPFYLQRRITVVNWKNELTYGMAHQDTQDWMINTDTFWQRWDSNRRIFVLMSDSEYQALLRQYPQKKFHLLGKTLTNSLISNHPK